MATATKKKTTSRSTSKKTAARPTAKKAAAKKAAAMPSVATATERLDEVNDRINDTIEKSVKFARDAAHTYIGVGLVIQDRVARRDFTTVDYADFLDQAKTMGTERVEEFRGRVEPYAKRVTERFEPITNRIESNLPKPVKDAVDASRDRVRDLLAV